MNDFIIFADSGCDLPPQTLADWGVKHLNLTFKFKDSEQEYENGDIPAKEFFDRMRDGRVATTSAVNMDSFKAAFRLLLEDGKDIFYIAFSSGLSTTFNSACMAAEELKAEFPERRVLCIDSLSASAGYGMLVYFAVKAKNEGKSMDEIAEICVKKREGLCHWFTVDNLTYLKRGGRISPTVAVVGSLLGIKPILHMDDEGHLVSVSKVRGRNAALTALADTIGEKAAGKPDSPIYICHADCMQDVNTLKRMIADKYKLPVDMVVDIGAVIGAHAGPGTIAVFFSGNTR